MKWFYCSWINKTCCNNWYSSSFRWRWCRYQCVESMCLLYKWKVEAVFWLAFRHHSNGRFGCFFPCCNTWICSFGWWDVEGSCHTGDVQEKKWASFSSGCCWLLLKSGITLLPSKFSTFRISVSFQCRQINSLLPFYTLVYWYFFCLLVNHVFHGKHGTIVREFWKHTTRFFRVHRITLYWICCTLIYEYYVNSA